MNNNEKGFGNSSGSQQAPPYQEPGQAYGQAPHGASQPPPYQGQAYQGQSQPYAQPYGQAYGQAPPVFTGVAPVKSPSSGSLPRKEEEMFKSDEWRDLWAAVLYYAHLVGLVVLAAIYGPYAFKNFSSSSRDWESHEMIGVGVLVGSLASAVALVTSFLSMVSAAPESIIKGTLITSVALNFGTAIACFFAPSGMVMGIFLLISAGISALFFFSCRDRIPFSSVLLKTVVDIFQAYPSVWSLPVISIAGFSVVTFVISVVISGIAVFVDENHRDKNGFEGSAILFCIFSLYWNFNVIENVVHTTVAGTIASFYFLSGTAAAVANPVFLSLQRAMTLSFGSICFGSLILAIIQLIRFLAKSGRGKDRDNIAAVLAECLLKILEDLVRYISFYAYVHVAIYGKPFIASAKDTWELITNHGIDVIINDNIVGTSMGIAVLMIACINGALSFLILNLVLSKSNNPESIIWIYGGTMVAFLIGACVAALPIQLISAGVSTTLVCYAENPQALERTKPELYHEITSRYRSGNNGI